MVTSTPQIMFRDEYVREFQLKESLIRDRVTTNAQIKGYQATFLVAGSGGATATTRGSNGLIPERAVSKTQKTATLTESHDLQTQTGFDIFSSQGNQKQIMSDSSMEVIYRSMDQKILTALSGATVVTNSGAATTASLALVNTAITTLGNAKAGGGTDVMTALITPSFESYLSEIDAFSNADYVDTKMFMTNAHSAFDWRGVRWIVHPELAGVGTASATCYMFNRSAIGHAYDSSGIDTDIGYDGKQQISHVRASVFDGAVLLQNSGIVKIIHNDSGNSL